MENVVVIITYARSLMALTIAESVRPLADRVIGVDSVGLTPLSFSKYCDETRQVPEVREVEAYCEALAALCEAQAADRVLVMAAFEDLELLVRRRDLFPEHTIIAGPEAASIDRVTPKDRFAQLAAEHAIAMPRTEVFQTPDHAPEEPPLDVPFLMKPARGAGGRGIAKIKSAEEFDAYLSGARERYPLLAQALADGEDYCVSALAKDGRILAASAYRNLETFPKETGAGVVRETVDAAPFLEAVSKIARATGWTGVFETDFMWSGDPEAAPLALEVNARFWAGVRHSKLSGVDYPRLLAELALFGETRSEIGEPEIGFRSQVPLAWAPSALDAVMSQSDYARRLQAMWSRLNSSRSFDPKRFARFTAALFDARAAGHALEDAVFQMADRSSLDVDLLAKDDPAAALGAMFVVSHLVKYGKLPPEISFESVGA